MKPTIPSRFPDDILFLILPNLPVKSLLRFTSISKSTNAWIRDSTFAVTYHHYQIHNKINNINGPYILHVTNDDEAEWQLCSLRKIDESKHEEVEVCNVLLPLRDYNVVGDCEGLVCLTNDSDIYIWNPWVGAMKVVPPAQPLPERAKVFYRFDFSYRSSDYRVIKQILVDFVGSEKLILYFEIYSLSTDLWKRIDFNADWLIFSTTERLVERFVFWMGVNRETEISILVRFDLEEEIFEEVTNAELQAGLARWKVATERDEGKYKAAFPLYQWGHIVRGKYYSMMIKEILTLFDQKDKNGYGFGSVFDQLGAMGRQIKDN